MHLCSRVYDDICQRIHCQQIGWNRGMAFSPNSSTPKGLIWADERLYERLYGGSWNKAIPIAYFILYILENNNIILSS